VGPLYQLFLAVLDRNTMVISKITTPTALS
jgi:hypothetical protein